MLKDTRRPMPGALRQRLKDIPRREVPCRDVDRLYRVTLRRARGEDSSRLRASGATYGTRDTAPSDAAAERHLAECPRCRELYDTLSSALTVRRLPLPRRLVSNLGSIARHPGRFLPIWIADSRYAAAACYLLAALALSLAGDASALLRDTTATVSSKTQAWVDENEARGLKALDATTATLGKGIDGGWHRVTRYGASFEKTLTYAYVTIATTTQELIPGRDRPVEGDQDGESRNDGE